MDPNEVSANGASVNGASADGASANGASVNGASTNEASATASPSPQRLANKIAIVTGASSGIGRAIATTFATHGATVVCSDLQPVARVHLNEKDVKATHEVILEHGGKSAFVECDVRDSQSVQDLIAKTVDLYGRLDIMVNNAGIAVDTRIPIYETPDSMYDSAMAVNSRGVFLGCKYAALQMVGQDPHPSGDRGWIINMASIAGLVGFVGSACYAASKGSVVQMTKTVALDLAPWRIHCNALCPGMVKTPLMKSLVEDKVKQGPANALHPFKGLGEAEDVAKAAVFLASEDASWVSGTAVPVDGCYTAR